MRDQRLDGGVLTAMADATGAVVKNHEYIFSHYKFIGFAIAALEYIAIQHQLPKPSSITKQAIADVLDLGILINDHFDVHTLDTKKYKHLRRRLGKDEENQRNFSTYFQCIRDLERNRPKPGDLEGCINYREKVNLISISLSCALAYNIPMKNLISFEDENEHSPIFSENSPAWFQSLFYIIMSGQVTDDLMGWEADAHGNKPSFYTGLVENGEAPNKNTIKTITELHNKYLKKAKDLDPTTSLPFQLFIKGGHDAYTKVFLFLQKHKLQKLTRLLLSQRDGQEVCKGQLQHV